jgi:ATP-dependent 26S proteasome regulatory subunit
MSANNLKELFDRIEASTGLIFVNTFEETRLIREIKEKFPDDHVQFWSMSQGLHEVKKDEEDNIVKPHDYPEKECRAALVSGKKTSGNQFMMLDVVEDDSRKKVKNKLNVVERHVYVLRDLDKYFNNPGTIRKLRDIVYLVSTAGSSMIICGPGITVPNDLEKDSAYVDLSLPTRDEIKDDILKERVQDLIKINNNDVRDGKGSKDDQLDENFDKEEVTRACMGLNEEEIINTIAYSLTVHKKVEPRIILEEKRQIISKNDILTYFNCVESLDDLGGFKVLKEWFAVQRAIMDSPEHAAKFFADQPKGILLLGIQGSGKTLAGKAMATDWGKGMIQLDMGKVFAGLVGESEKRMRMALAQAEAAGGIILIDELDKGLAGAGSSDRTDGGTTKRVIGTLLSWMQEPHPGLFIIATANDITNLRTAHPELLRKGRFDELWFSDSPNQQERKDIYSIHLRKRGRDPENFNINKLAKKVYEHKGKKYKYVGAEIEYAIKESISYKFSDKYKGKSLKVGTKSDITTKDIEIQLDKIIPITKVGKVAVENNRKWAADNAQNVSEFGALKAETAKNSNDTFNSDVTIV